MLYLFDQNHYRFTILLLTDSLKLKKWIFRGPLMNYMVKSGWGYSSDVANLHLSDPYIGFFSQLK